MIQFKFSVRESGNFVVVVLCLLLLMTGCEEQKTTKKRSPKTLPAVEINQVRTIPLSHTITLTGTLEPARSVHLYNQTEGLLLELPFYEGDIVKAQELLARLDDTIIKAEYDKAEANFKQSQLDYGRLEKLAPTNLTSKELLTRARTKVKLDQAEYSLYQKRLSDTRIKAPWTGVISERLAEPGDVLPIHTHFMTLIDTSNLIVKIALSELYLSKINQGDPISLVIDALGPQSWTGNVLRIYPKIDPETRKGIIEVSLSPVPEGAKPGQLTRVSIITPEENVLVIPISSIRYDQQGAYVFIVTSEDIIERKNIVLGKKYPLYIEVLEGLKEGENVISKGLFGLRNGKKVKVLNRSAQE